MINFYRRFIPRAAKILKTPTNALKGGQKKQVVWSAEMQVAFTEIKAALCACTLLTHRDQQKGLCLTSGSHVGAVLQQREKKSILYRPLQPFQRSWTALSHVTPHLTESCWRLGVHHFRRHLEGRKFHILRDHKPLSFALHKAADAWAAQ
jgi:RNase H-like domain found in reverse transcriptase